MREAQGKLAPYKEAGMRRRLIVPDASGESSRLNKKEGANNRTEKHSRVTIERGLPDKFWMGWVAEKDFSKGAAEGRYWRHYSEFHSESGVTRKAKTSANHCKH